MAVREADGCGGCGASYTTLHGTGHVRRCDHIISSYLILAYGCAAVADHLLLLLPWCISVVGIRDTANLAWKLSTAIEYEQQQQQQAEGGSADDGVVDRLLDSYESERRPHVRCAPTTILAYHPPCQPNNQPSRHHRQQLALTSLLCLLCVCSVCSALYNNQGVYPDRDPSG